MNGPALARQPNPLPNPFRPDNGVPPPYLSGRDRLLANFEDWLLEEPPLHADWTLSGLRGTGKTVLLGEFATRAERAGWLTLQRELGDRHRDDLRLAEALIEDCEALIARANTLAAIGQAVERGARWLRPKRIRIGHVSVDPSYTSGFPAAGDAMRTALLQLDSVMADRPRPRLPANPRHVRLRVAVIRRLRAATRGNNKAIVGTIIPMTLAFIPDEAAVALARGGEFHFAHALHG